jgi:hypothetical protein
MKLNRIITLCAVAATLAISVSSLLAQDNGNNNGGGQRRNRQNGGPGGPGGQGGWGDPAQRTQRLVDGVRDRLDFTNDTEWDAVKPLVQKVVELQSDLRSGQMRAIFSGRNRGGDQGSNNRQRGGGFLGQSSPEEEALQKAIDDAAPAAQIKDLLAKYRAAQKTKQTKLEAAQAELKAVLTSKQEAQAALLGLVN